MTHARVISLFSIVFLLAVAGYAQIHGQFAEDFVAGEVPGDELMADLERQAAERPEDFRLVRKLGKGYFFQYFGEGRTSARGKAEKMLERALKMRSNDAETIAYLGGLAAVDYSRSKDTAEREADGRLAMERLKRALSIAPTHGAVVSIAAASFVWLHDSFNTAPLAADLMEKTRAALGPVMEQMSHHGRQRIMITQGQAYVRMGKTEEAVACFKEALAVNGDSVEAAIARGELASLAKKP